MFNGQAPITNSLARLILRFANNGLIRIDGPRFVYPYWNGPRRRVGTKLWALMNFFRMDYYRVFGEIERKPHFELLKNDFGFYFSRRFFSETSDRTYTFSIHAYGSSFPENGVFPFLNRPIRGLTDENCFNGFKIRRGTVWIANGKQ